MGFLDGLMNALTGGVGKSLQAGQESREEFRRIWYATYQSNPPEAALQSIAGVSVAIVTHMNNGNHSYGAQKIEADMKIYADAVGWDREKIELGTVFLLMKCSDGTGNVPRQLQWAVEPISSVLLR